jgi:hypothetical protein
MEVQKNEKLSINLLSINLSVSDSAGLRLRPGEAQRD